MIRTTTTTTTTTSVAILAQVATAAHALLCCSLDNERRRDTRGFLEKMANGVENVGFLSLFRILFRVVGAAVPAPSLVWLCSGLFWLAPLLAEAAFPPCTWHGAVAGHEIRWGGLCCGYPSRGPVWQGGRQFGVSAGAGVVCASWGCVAVRSGVGVASSLLVAGGPSL